ncbi:MAG: hypothetical protein PVI78_08965 [Anaerolineales bacterium]|jgi:hypothetical protein
MPIRIDPPPADDEIECGRCGAHFYYELNRCPHCGVNVYEPDDENDQPSEKSASQNNLGARIDGFIRRFTKKPYPVDELFGVSINQAELYENLLMKVGGDRATVERLIDYERQQYPQGNRITWLSNAIQRWERDNRSPGIDTP